MVSTAKRSLSALPTSSPRWYYGRAISCCSLVILVTTAQVCMLLFSRACFCVRGRCLCERMCHCVCATFVWLCCACLFFKVLFSIQIVFEGLAELHQWIRNETYNGGIRLMKVTLIIIISSSCDTQSLDKVIALIPLMLNALESVVFVTCRASQFLCFVCNIMQSLHMQEVFSLSRYIC